MISNALEIEKCANCGHDIMASGDLVKHTNTKDGHRFFTKFCQECECSEPAKEGKKTELDLEVGKIKTREKVADLVRQGKTTGEISRTLQLASSTVSYHVSAIKATESHETNKAEGLRETAGETIRKPTDEIAVPRKENENLRKTDSPDMGILKSRVEVSCFEGYYDTQKKLISETVKEEIYHAGKGKTITMEVRKLPDRTRVVVEITGEDAQ